MLYDTKLEDFDDAMKQSFYATINRLGKSEEWGRAALRINSVDNWYQYKGFGGFAQPWMEIRVASILKGQDITIEKVYAELQELKEDYLNFVNYVNSKLGD